MTSRNARIFFLAQPCPLEIPVDEYVSVRPWVLRDRGSTHSLKMLLDVKVGVEGMIN